MSGKRSNRPSNPARRGGRRGGPQAAAPEQTQQTQSDVTTIRLQRRTRELAILNAIAGALNRSLDMGEALRETLALVGELLGLRAGWVWLLEDNGASRLAASQALPPYLADPAHPERMSGSCHCLRTFVRGDLRGAANVNIVECSRLWEAYHEPGGAAEAEGLRYHASIPLYAGTKHLGVMNVASTDWRRLEPEELQFLYTIGNQVGLAVERARLFAEGTRAAARLATAEERNRLAREAGVALDYAPPAAFPRLPARVEAGIYRIAQEALTNITRHAQARRIALMLRREDETVVLAVCDDGVGFDPEQLSRHTGAAAGEEGHYGLVGMGERARLLGATLTLESAPGEGTRVEVRAPLP